MNRLLVVVLAVAVLFTLVQPAVYGAQGKAPAKGQSKAPAMGKAMTASGKVTSVSNDSLKITAAGGKDMTFTVDSGTKFIGKGLTTKSKEKGKMTAQDSVGMNDQVSVTYHDMNGTMHAESVRITAKGAKK